MISIALGLAGAVLIVGGLVLVTPGLGVAAAGALFLGYALLRNDGKRT